MKDKIQDPENGTTVHHHYYESSGMWIGVAAAFFFACLAISKISDNWKAVELEKIKSQQSLKITDK